MRATVAWGLWLAGCTQEAVPVRLQVPEISVAPDAVPFGPGVVPLGLTEFVTVENAGQAELTVRAAIEGGDGVFTHDLTDLALRGGESEAIAVTFTPTTYLDYAAELVLRSNDVDTPVVRVPLTGTGVLGPIPDIDVSERTVDFGEVAQGDDDTRVLTVHNTGAAPLRLGQLTLTGSGAFSLLTDPSGFEVPASQYATVVLRYTPGANAGDDATLMIPSDDPDEPAIEVLLIGNGGANIAFPVASIMTDLGPCPVTSAPPQWVTFDGSASQDPEGRTPLTWHWSLLDRPSGSQAGLTSLVGPDSRLFTDVAGDYRVALYVENAIGVRSAPAVCTVQAIPADALHVELVWDGQAADVDLHLVRDGGEMFDVRSDVNWCNKHPRWGDAASSDDDPRLDLDEQHGLGPENINILAPADGNYRVMVHYFDDNGDGRQQATVRIYLNGSVLPDYEVSQILERDQVWEVAEVRWPAATVAPLSVTPYPAEARNCY